MDNVEKKRLFYLDFLRFIACVLITNSHFDGVYPLNISWGGCPGNCLFLMISGFLLFDSIGKKKSFVFWFIPKVLRLYIPLFIINIITVSVGFRKPSLELFFFPINEVWFIPCIVLLYFAYYFAIKYKAFLWLYLVIDFAIYVVLYCRFDLQVFFVEKQLIFRYLYGFIAMMIGAFIKSKNITAHDKTKALRLITVSIFGIIGFLGVKLGISEGIKLALYMQFLTQVFSMLFATAAFIGFSYFNDKIEYFMRNSALGKLTYIISSCTLEVYLVQFVLIANIKALVFPLNFVLIILAIMFSALLLHVVSNEIYIKVIDYNK